MNDTQAQLATVRSYINGGTSRGNMTRSLALDALAVLEARVVAAEQERDAALARADSFGATIARSLARAHAAEGRLQAATDALRHVLDEAMNRWHKAPTDVSAVRWLGLTNEEYAMYAEARFGDLIDSLAARAVLVGDTEDES